jgi:protein-S-isoprenylcysteine O-methyltransferase Ste14
MKVVQRVRFQALPNSRHHPRSYWIWGLATVPLLALLLSVRIGIEEKTLRMGLEGYDDYARRARWRLVPLIW